MSGYNDRTIALCLIGRLWKDRSYNTFGLMETMKKLWCPSKGMTCREMGSNMISFQFNDKRDMERVVVKQPWHFNKHILVFSPIFNEIQPSMMTFDKTACWIRLYDIPMVGRREDALQQIGRRLGELKEIDASTTSGIASVRLKVVLDLTKPLKRGTKVRIGDANVFGFPLHMRDYRLFAFGVLN